MSHYVTDCDTILAREVEASVETATGKCDSRPRVSSVEIFNFHQRYDRGKIGVGPLSPVLVISATINTSPDWA
jgi:hypothetical protein